MLYRIPREHYQKVIEDALRVIRYARAGLSHVRFLGIDPVSILQACRDRVQVAASGCKPEMPGHCP